MHRGHPFDELKLIMVFHIGNNRIDRLGLQIFVARSKLIKDVRVTRVQHTDEDHYQQERRDDHLAMGHIQDHAVEARAKLHNRLRIPLNVVEEQHKSRECVCDRVGVTVAIKNINHFKTLAVKT